MAKSKRDWRKHKLDVIARRDVHTLSGIIKSGSIVKLHSPQMYRNDDIRVLFNNIWIVVDHIDFILPKQATAHLPEPQRLYAQGLETFNLNF
jgi:hypothetical protein